MDEELTPIQQSITETGRRFFRLNEDTYVILCAEIDERRGFPSPTGDTIRSLALPEEATRVHEGDDILVSVETWRILPEDEEMLAPALEIGQVIELTYSEYNDLLPPQLNI